MFCKASHKLSVSISLLVTHQIKSAAEGENKKMNKKKLKAIKHQHNRKLKKTQQIERHKTREQEIKTGKARKEKGLPLNFAQRQHRFDSRYLNKVRLINVGFLTNNQISDLHSSRVFMSELQGQVVRVIGMVSDLGKSKNNIPMILIDKPAFVGNVGPKMAAIDQHIWLFMNKCYGVSANIVSPIKYISIGDYIIIEGLIEPYKGKVQGNKHYASRWGVSKFVVNSCGQITNFKHQKPDPVFINFDFINNYNRFNDWIIHFKNVKHFEKNKVTPHDLQGEPQINYEVKPSRYPSFIERVKQNNKKACY